MAFDRQPRSFIDTAVLAQLSAIPLTARQPMLGNVSGRHTSPHRGASVEFAEYRKYVPGDDLRRLDWRAYGRSDRFYIKEFEADTNSAWAGRGHQRFDGCHRSVACFLRGGWRLRLSYLAIQQGDAVGLACVADGRPAIPRRNPAHLSTLFDQLEMAQPQGATKLTEVLHELAETVRQRALVILLSDLFVPPAELRECFEHLRFRKHDVSVFHLLDPEEIRFNLQRPTRFLDLEGGPAVFADPVEIADRYQQALAAYLDELRSVVLETAVDYRRVELDQPYDQTLRGFLVDRAYRRRSR